MTGRWTRTMVRHRVAVLMAWLLLAVLGAMAGPRLSGELTALTSVPGSPSAAAERALQEHFDESADGGYALILEFGQATPEEIERLADRIGAAATAVPSARLVHHQALGGYLFAYVATSLDLAAASAATPDLRRALDEAGLQDVLVSGPPALEHDVRPVLSGDLVWGGAVALSLALLLLVLALGLSLAALVPLAVAGITIGASLLALFGAAQVVDMVLYVPNVVELIGLGLAIDYALLIVHRYRREVRSGADAAEAVMSTMATAGRTVATSAVTVAIALSTLLLVPVPFVRSMGVAGVLVALVSLTAAMTLQPALLSLLGDHIAAPRRFDGFLARRESRSSRVTRLVTQRPLLAIMAAITVLLALALPVTTVSLAPASLTAVPQRVEAARALTLLTEKAGPGVVTPHEVLVDLGRGGLGGSVRGEAARQRLVDVLSDDPTVLAVASDDTAFFRDPSGRFQRVFVMSRHDFGDARTQAQVAAFRTLDLAALGYPEDAQVLVAGAPAQGYDFLQRLRMSMPWVVGLVLALAFIVMARGLRSIVLPLKAVVLNLVTVLASLGAVALAFGTPAIADLLGTEPTTSLESWSLVFLFAALFGLSMDYHIFMASRIREAWDHGQSTVESVATGLRSTGAVVVTAALIFVGALSGLVFGEIEGLRKLGLGLAIGVLLDATVVRTVLLPSAMVLLDRWNWWLPAPVARVLMTEASPLEDRGARLPVSSGDQALTSRP